ncbi:MAG TPA: HEAT repeat domain-containing protein [Roseiflexaceae bacterium]|nr:HEAT repeat domain-containing protein [Roseiflexaceae bacterium]
MKQTLPATDRRSRRIAALIEALAAADVVVRERARNELLDLGAVAVPALIAALGEHDGTVRWEAAKALGQIGTPEAAPALVLALSDQRFDVRWLAAEGLIGLGDASIRPLLQALRAATLDDAWLREGALRVLRAQGGNAPGHPLAAVVAALSGPEPSVSVPLAAYRALEATAAASGE